METDALVRRLAEKRGMGITDAIKEAAIEALEADYSRAVRNNHAAIEEQLKPLFRRLDRLPRPTGLSEKAFFDDLWGEGER